jgi:proteic killer suppression protein
LLPNNQRVPRHAIRLTDSAERITFAIVIKSFKGKTAKALFDGEDVKAFRAFARIARRKLDMLDAAVNLGDLRNPPGNYFEALRGDRKGQHSIRINDKYRICFVWNDGAEQVEIVDYH